MADETHETKLHEMRRGLMALRLMVPQDVADELSARFEAFVVAESLERWAQRVLWSATENDWHISQPYPHKKLGGWELIATPPNARDQLHHGDTAALCVIAAARALCAEDATLPKEPGT